MQNLLSSWAIYKNKWQSWSGQWARVGWSLGYTNTTSWPRPERLHKNDLDGFLKNANSWIPPQRFWLSSCRDVCAHQDMGTNGASLRSFCAKNTWVLLHQLLPSCIAWVNHYISPELIFLVNKMRERVGWWVYPSP